MTIFSTCMSCIYHWNLNVTPCTTSSVLVPHLITSSPPHRHHNLITSSSPPHSIPLPPVARQRLLDPPSSLINASLPTITSSRLLIALLPACWLPQPGGGRWGRLGVCRGGVGASWGDEEGGGAGCGCGEVGDGNAGGFTNPHKTMNRVTFWKWEKWEWRKRGRRGMLQTTKKWRVVKLLRRREAGKHVSDAYWVKWEIITIYCICTVLLDTLEYLMFISNNQNS